MITIKKILWSGGACPYQIEAITDDDAYFYLRYRHGCLRYGVWESEQACDHQHYQFVKTVGDEYDGWADNDVISKELDGLVTFPEGFVHSFEGEKPDDYPPEGCWEPPSQVEAENELKKLFGIDNV